MLKTASVLAALIALPSTGNAVQLSYEYSGNTLYCIQDLSDTCETTPILPALSASFTSSNNLNGIYTWKFESTGFGDIFVNTWPGDEPALLRATMSIDGISEVSMSFNQYQPTSWFNAYLGNGSQESDGSQTIASMPSNLGYDVLGFADGVYASREAGTWTVAPVPLPAPFAMLIAGICAIGLASRRSLSRRA